MLYQAYQAHCDIMGPVRALAGIVGTGRPSSNRLSDTPLLRNLTAAYELIARAGLTHQRPPFGIDTVRVGNREVEVWEELACVTPFGTLIHFRKDVEAVQPRVLLVRRCRATLRRSCARPSPPCCPSTTSTSPTGTTRATSRCWKAASASTTTSST